jgi:DNA repair protein RadC
MSDAAQARRLLRERPELAARLLFLAQSPPATRVSSPEDVYRQVAPLLLGQTEERLVLLCLNRRLFPLSCETLTVGSDRVTVVDPRQILRRALCVGRSGATAIVLAHNHPSGDKLPSAQDRDITRKVIAGCNAVGIEMLDHMVVAGPDLWHSMRQTDDVGFSPPSNLSATWTN